MISEGSCDIEDWSNAENSALHHRINYILQYIEIEKNIILNCENFHNITVLIL